MITAHDGFFYSSYGILCAPARAVPTAALYLSTSVKSLEEYLIFLVVNVFRQRFAWRGPGISPWKQFNTALSGPTPVLLRASSFQMLPVRKAFPWHKWHGGPGNCTIGAALMGLRGTAGLHWRDGGGTYYHDSGHFLSVYTPWLFLAADRVCLQGKHVDGIAWNSPVDAFYSGCFLKSLCLISSSFLLLPSLFFLRVVTSGIRTFHTS